MSCEARTRTSSSSGALEADLAGGGVERVHRLVDVRGERRRRRARRSAADGASGRRHALTLGAKWTCGKVQFRGESTGPLSGSTCTSTWTPGRPAARAGLERALRDAIRAGRLAPETRLPSTRALAAELGLSRGTVSAAYDQLVAEGYLTAATGSGTVVAALARPTIRAARAGRDLPPRFDLRPGSPDVSSFPIAAWLRATRRALARRRRPRSTTATRAGRASCGPRSPTTWGGPAGCWPSPERIVITSGYVQALCAAGAVLVRGRGRDGGSRPGLPPRGGPPRRRPAWCRCRSTSGARAPSWSGDWARVRAVVVTPAHQYPTGVTLHPARRRALTEWAAAAAAWSSRTTTTASSATTGSRSARCRGWRPTTSPTSGPRRRRSVRPCGWAGWCCPSGWSSRCVEAKRHADLHTETLGQLTLADLITTHAYDRHVRASRLRYRRRRDLLVDRLAPLRRTVDRPASRPACTS